MSKLHVVALISGGKDSFYSILHCIAQGHDVVALANLHPAANDVEDIDSFMYQTVGHGVIPLYEQALGLPLYRQAIEGSATNTDKTYSVASRTGDETESLVPLLQRVMMAHPKINAISSGAILSDYQRTRVESVALRLGLTPLAYLWQYPRIVTHSPTSLLEDMAAAGQDARIIKVSSGALDDSYLWSNVADAKTITRLRKASERFGDLDNGAALGEGGEFETLAVDGPSPLWKASIIIEPADRIVVQGEAGSAALRIRQAHTIAKAPSEHERANVRTPELLSASFHKLLQDRQSNIAQQFPSLSRAGSSTSRQDTYTIPDLVIQKVTAAGRDVGEQTTAIMLSIETQLRDAGHTFDDITYTSIILRDMADFAAVNAAYKTAFTQPHPPARMTLACAAALPADSSVSISVSSRKVDRPHSRQGLHIQSLSYWAPANIGPYSQAIALPTGLDDSSSVVYIAGQIPLVPATLCLLKSDFLQQAILSLQHLHRIRLAMHVQRWIHAVAFVTASDSTQAALRAEEARRVWSQAYTHAALPDTEDEDVDFEADFDVWHQQYGSQRQHNLGRTKKDTAASGAIWTTPAPPLRVFLVDSLPRQADIEWVAFGSTAANMSGIESVPHFQHILEAFAKQAV